MVVRIPDSFRDLFSNGNVKIPCQCYYNARDNLLTEILQHSYIQLHKSENTTSFENQKQNEFECLINKNAPEKKNAETETIPEPCCVCEYFRLLEKSKNKKDLWNMQFNRWWGWNWQRKRKDFLSKFKSKCDKNYKKPSNSKVEPSNSNHHICQCQREIPPDNCKSKSDISQKNIPELAEISHPIPPITTYGFKKPYVGRRKRNKYKQRLYEGWIREVTSSDSDNSIKSVKIKMKSPKITSNNKDYMNYLSLRLRKFNSEESLDDDKMSNHEETKIESKTNLQEKINYADSKYISPISGKCYSLNLPDFSNPFSGIMDSEYLQPLDIKNEQIIPKHDYDWMKHYTLMKQEHNELLKSICEVMCSRNIKQLKEEEHVQSEEEIRQFLYSDTKDITVQENVDENKTENVFDLKTPRLNVEPKSESIILPTNPFYECSLVKSLPNYGNYCTKYDTLPNYKPLQQSLLISKSSNLFYQDTVEYNCSEPQERKPDSILKNEEKIQDIIKDSNTMNLNYDINYISNNLQSFSSTISDTDFLICRTEVSNINITEEMSERIIQDADLFK